MGLPRCALAAGARALRGEWAGVLCSVARHDVVPQDVRRVEQCRQHDRLRARAASGESGEAEVEVVAALSRGDRYVPRRLDHGCRTLSRVGNAPVLGERVAAEARTRSRVAREHRDVGVEPRPFARCDPARHRAAEEARPSGERVLALVAPRRVRHRLPRLSAAARRSRLLHGRHPRGARRGNPRDGLHEPAALVHRNSELDCRARRHCRREGARRTRARGGLQHLRSAAVRHHGCHNVALAEQVRRDGRHRARPVWSGRHLHGSGSALARVLGRYARPSGRRRPLLDGWLPRARARHTPSRRRWEREDAGG